MEVNRPNCSIRSPAVARSRWKGCDWAVTSRPRSQSGRRADPQGTLEYPQKYGQPNSRPVPQYILDADADSTQPGFSDGEWAAAYRHNPLATDVRYWGAWVLERAREELAEFYPADPDGRVPVAYIWSRTIPCPSCTLRCH